MANSTKSSKKTSKKVSKKPAPMAKKKASKGAVRVKGRAVSSKKKTAAKFKAA